MITINLSGLCHHYDERGVFEDLNFTFAGNRLAIVGPNGSGKSTLLRIFAGLISPTAGSMTIDMGGVTLDRQILRNCAGLAAPDIRLYDDLTTRENLQFLLSARSINRKIGQIDEVLQRVGLQNRADEPIASLSTGLRQRASIAAAIVHAPALLLLDEPSSNLDEDGIRMIKSIVGDHKGTVIIATNDPAEAAIASEMLDLGEAR